MGFIYYTECHHNYDCWRRMRVVKCTACSKELVTYHIARGQAVLVIDVFTKEYNDV